MRSNMRSTQIESGSTRTKLDVYGVDKLATAHSRQLASETSAEHPVLRALKRSATDQVRISAP